ncbi:MAG: conjugal transfer protein TrbL family protein, partial [Candidatus Dormibacteraceae bacterium]
LSALLQTVLARIGGLGNDALWMVGSFVLVTNDPTNGQPLTQMAVIGHLVPLTQALGDAGLTAAVMWGCYKEIWVGGSSRSGRSRVSFRRVIPRLALAALLINTCLPLIQGIIDANNAICRAIVNVTEISAQAFVGHELTADWGAPSPGTFVAALLLVSYVLLGISYVIRFALLVLLVVLSPLAALLFVLPETQHWAHTWATLFFAALFSQPLQLLVLALGLSLDAYMALPIGHLFALATVLICFRIPGALHSTSSVGRKAMGTAKAKGKKYLKLALK